MLRILSRMLRLAAVPIAAVVVQQALCAVTDSTASFSVTSATEVPGATLKPGQYTIRLVDHLTDRSIVRLDSATGSTHVTFLGVTSASATSEAPHPVEWPEKVKGRRALRGFVFGSGSSVEFVYPKADAVALATANNTGVVAIDPSSEGRPELSKLNSSDMQMVNLWMLTPVRVGPGSSAQKGIEAKRYAASPELQTVNTANAQPQVAPTRTRSTVARTTVTQVEAPNLPTPRHVRPAITQLPKTASDLPIVEFAGAMFLMIGIGMRLRRKQKECD